MRVNLRQRLAVNLPIVAVGGAVASALLGDAMPYAVMPARPAAWGLSVGMVGVLLSVNRFVRLASNPLAAVVFNRFGPRAPFGIAMAVAVVVTATYGWATAFWVLLLARVTWGACWSVLRLGGFWTVLDVASDDSRGLMMGTYNAVARLGGIGGALVGGVLMDAMGHRATLNLFALITAAGGLRWYLAVGRRAPASQQAVRAGGPPGGLGAVLRDPRLLALSAGGLVTGLAFAGLVTASLGFFLAEQFGEEVPVFGVAIGVASVSGVMLGTRWLLALPVAPLAGLVSDRLGRAPVTVAAFLLGSLGLLVLAGASGSELVVVGLLVTFTAAIALNTLLITGAGDLASLDRRAAVLTTYATFQDLGAALGPLAGLSAASLPVLRAMFVAAAVLLVLLAIWHRIAFAHAPAVAPVDARPPEDASVAEHERGAGDS